MLNFTKRSIYVTIVGESRSLIKNIMSVDLEDYYCDLPFSTWNKYEDRVVSSTEVILELFEKYNVKATFFTLGYIAERHPELIEEIKSKGHEIASHGYSHTDIRKMNKEGFEADLLKSLKVLETLYGEKILGFRAPFFSINKQNFWVFDILKKYLKYDSSVFPVKTPLYGIPDAPRFPYKMSDDDPLKEDPHSRFIEIPLATLRFLLGNIPIAGGFHMRFWPIQLLKYGINKMNKAGFHAMCYIHPKDLDPSMPRIRDYSWHYYWGLNGAAKKFEFLLKNFEFSSAQDVMKL